MPAKTNDDLLKELNKKVFESLGELHDNEVQLASTYAIEYMEKKESETEKSYRYHRTRADAFSCAKNVASQIIVDYMRSLK